MEWEKQRIDDLVDAVVFYGLVGMVRAIVTNTYPAELFAGMRDKGPRFTQKLHEALAILDEPERSHDSTNEHIKR